MLQTGTSTPSKYLAPLGFLCKTETTTPSCVAREPVHSSAVLEPSIAETAGLSRFVYLVGRSQERYVFSAIRKSQISLYYEAIFMVHGGKDKTGMWVGNYTGLISHLNARADHNAVHIHVHLLAEGAEAKARIVMDLTAENIH